MPNLCIIPVRALSDPEMTPTQLRALLAIGHFSDAHGNNVWAANKTLSEIAGLDVRHFRRAVVALIERGYVRKIVRPGTTCLLSVRLDPPETEGAESAHPPQKGRAESAQGGRATVAPQTTPITTPLHDDDGARARVGFTHPEALAAYRRMRARVADPQGFDAMLRTVVEPMTGGEAYTWDEVGAALVELAPQGMASANAIRAFCRKARQPVAASVPANRGGVADHVDAALDFYRRVQEGTA